MAGITTVQGKITTTAVAQQLPSHPGRYSRVTLTAKSTNVAPIAVTLSSAGGAVDGTGTGYILEHGTSVVLTGLNDTAALWVSGTAADVYSLIAVN